MTSKTSIIIIDKCGKIKQSEVINLQISELYKKCNFKKNIDFENHAKWTSTINGIKYFIHLYGKTNGKANTENKYDFPPPVDNTLFFGSCAIVCYVNDPTTDKVFVNLTKPLWETIYNKLFGGFEDLSSTIKDDEEEEDELLTIPSSLKSQGYLKDGFVVDSNSDSESEHTLTILDTEEDEEEEINLEMMNFDSELSEESYETDDEEEI